MSRIKKVRITILRCPRCGALMVDDELEDGRCPCGGTPERLEVVHEKAVKSRWSIFVGVLGISLLALSVARLLGLIDLSTPLVITCLWLALVLNIMDAYGPIKK